MKQTELTLLKSTQRIISSETKGAVTLCNVSRNLSRNTLRGIAQAFTLGNGLVWRRNEAKRCMKLLQKVEPCSTFRNSFCNLPRNIFGLLQGMPHSAMFRATCLAMGCREKLHEILHIA